MSDETEQSKTDPRATMGKDSEGVPAVPSFVATEQTTTTAVGGDDKGGERPPPKDVGDKEGHR